jgi:hypothetical protein
VKNAASIGKSINMRPGHLPQLCASSHYQDRHYHKQWNHATTTRTVDAHKAKELLM